ncbi:hypothetical protein ABZ476_33415, partial [Streptomyces albogriseolus]
MTASAQPLTLAAEAGAGGTLLWVVLPYVSLAIFVLGTPGDGPPLGPEGMREPRGYGGGGAG